MSDPSPLPSPEGSRSSAFQRGFFLLVARDDALAHALSEPIQRYSVVRRARCYRDALPMLLPRTRWSGVVVDLDGFDADPIFAIRCLREASPLIPVLAVSSKADVALVKRRLDSTHWKRHLPSTAMLSATAIGEYYLRPVDY